MSKLIAKRDQEAFWSRFERDQAASMTKEQWGEWVNSLPRPEFMAMVNLKTTAVPNGDR